jgi:hypothetical protein
MKTKNRTGFVIMVGFAIFFFLSAALNHGVAQERGPISPVRTCWCCIGGSIRLMTVPDCQKQGGQCFRSEQEASRYCSSSHAPRHRDGCWCAMGASQFPGYNPNAKVTYTSEVECAKMGGHCFSSREEAEHYVHTPQRRVPSTCWCCYGSGRATTRVIQTTMTECQARGGSCYQSHNDAERDCFMRGEFH